MKWLSEERNSSLLLIHHGMFFALGVFLWSELIKKHELKNLMWIAIFCVTGCLQIVVETDAVNREFSRDCPILLPCMLWILSIAFIVWSVRANALLHRQSPRVVRMIQTAGAMTYPLYLLHQIVGGALMGWMVSSGINRWTALFAAMALVFLATWIIAKHAEPLLQKWTKRAVDFVHERYLSLFRTFAR